MPWFDHHYDAPPLLIVRTVDREKTVGIFIVLEEHVSDRSFVATQITVKGGARELAPDPTPVVFHAVVEEDDHLGSGTATALARRVRWQQLGFFRAKDG